MDYTQCVILFFFMLSLLYSAQSSPAFCFHFITRFPIADLAHNLRSSTGIKLAGREWMPWPKEQLLGLLVFCHGAPTIKCCSLLFLSEKSMSKCVCPLDEYNIGRPMCLIMALFLNPFKNMVMGPFLIVCPISFHYLVYSDLAGKHHGFKMKL